MCGNTTRDEEQICRTVARGQGARLAIRLANEVTVWTVTAAGVDIEKAQTQKDHQLES